MDNTIKITAITLHKTSLGDQMAITYALIGENGNVISQNKRAEAVIMDSQIEEAIKTLYNFALSHVEGE